jgi:type IV pilus assembly protein PilX
MNIRMPSITFAPRIQRQQGAALIIGLLLLLIITVLAVSGMSTATLEIQMAGNAQYAHNAFQAAEMGIEQAIEEAKKSGKFIARANEPLLHASHDDRYDTAMKFNEKTGVTDIPRGDKSYSMAVDKGYKAFHFEITSTGAGARGASSTHTQSVYIKGQAGG